MESDRRPAPAIWLALGIRNAVSPAMISVRPPCLRVTLNGRADLPAVGEAMMSAARPKCQFGSRRRSPQSVDKRMRRASTAECEPVDLEEKVQLFPVYRR